MKSNPKQEMQKINRKNYERTMQFFEKNKFCRQALKIIYKYLPIVLFIAYPLLIGYVFFAKRSDIFKVILVPFGVFVTVTILRKIINEKRPYQRYNIPSLFNKTRSGQSMPSRHTACAFIIAMTILYINSVSGIIALLIATLIALSRVFAGVHYVRDVFAGMCISVGAGIIFFFLIQNYLYTITAHRTNLRAVIFYCIGNARAQNNFKR